MQTLGASRMATGTCGLVMMGQAPWREPYRKTNVVLVHRRASGGSCVKMGCSVWRPLKCNQRRSSRYIDVRLVRHKQRLALYMCATFTKVPATGLRSIHYVRRIYASMFFMIIAMIILSVDYEKLSQPQLQHQKTNTLAAAHSSTQKAFRQQILGIVVYADYMHR